MAGEAPTRASRTTADRRRGQHHRHQASRIRHRSCLALALPEREVLGFQPLRSAVGGLGLSSSTRGRQALGPPGPDVLPPSRSGKSVPRHRRSPAGVRAARCPQRQPYPPDTDFPTDTPDALRRGHNHARSMAGCFHPPRSGGATQPHTDRSTRTLAGRRRRDQLAKIRGDWVFSPRPQRPQGYAIVPSNMSRWRFDARRANGSAFR